MDRPGLTSRSDLDDLNSDAAAAYVLANARVSYEWEKGKLHLRAAARIDNLFDKRYVATVIVNEGNARYFEPAPGRAWLAPSTRNTSSELVLHRHCLCGFAV